MSRIITDAKELAAYRASLRLWQGIPSIEVTNGGRIFLSAYSGGFMEQIGNFSFLLVSDDGTIIRMAVDDISTYKRDTQGVRLMRVAEGSRVISIALMYKREEDEETEEEPAAE